MAHLEQRLLDICLETINASDGMDLLSIHGAFTEKYKQIKDSDDTDLKSLLMLINGVVSMYFEFDNGQVFGPESSFNGKRTMLPEDLRDEDINKLEDLLYISNNPEFIARIGDVLWIRFRNYKHAKIAFSAYLEAIDEYKGDCWVEKSEWLKRAVQISMELGEKAEERELVKAKLLNLFEESRNNCFNTQMGYWPHALLELIIENKLASNWEELGDKAMQIAQGFPISPGCNNPRDYYKLASKCFKIICKLGKEKEAMLAVARHWEAEANSFANDGFNRAFRLNNAIKAYRDIGGFKDKVEELICELKEANKSAITQLKPITVKLEVTNLMNIAYENLKGKNGIDIIKAFISLYSPQDYENEKLKAEELSKNYPIQSLCQESILTPEGNVAEIIPRMIDDSNGKMEASIIKQYNLGQSLASSTFLEAGVSLILKSDGSWKETVKQSINESQFIPKDRIGIYERAIFSGFDGDKLAFLHLIIPQIENSVRLLFEKCGFKTTSALMSGVQRERDLNELLKDTNAEKIFGKNLVWEMRSQLIEQSGPNLRNRVCHGLMGLDDIDSTSCNYLLWLVIYLLTGNPDCQFKV